MLLRPTTSSKTETVFNEINTNKYLKFFRRIPVIIVLILKYFLKQDRRLS